VEPQFVLIKFSGGRRRKRKDGKVRHKSLRDGMERRMSLMELRRMGRHKKSLELRMMVHRKMSLELHKSWMERIHRSLRFRVSSTERLGVLGRGGRDQYRQRGLSCIRVGHMMKMGRHSLMKVLRSCLRSLHDRLKSILHDRHLRAVLVATKFP